jgi:hypothetical protein
VLLRLRDEKIIRAESVHKREMVSQRRAKVREKTPKTHKGERARARVCHYHFHFSQWRRRQDERVASFPPGSGGCCCWLCINSPARTHTHTSSKISSSLSGSRSPTMKHDIIILTVWKFYCCASERLHGILHLLLWFQDGLLPLRPFCVARGR